MTQVPWNASHAYTPQERVRSNRTRANRALTVAGIRGSQTRRMTDDELLAIPGIGQGLVAFIRAENPPRRGDRLRRLLRNIR